MFDVFISDNSQTLDNDKINSKHINVFKNKNLGGSGGFTRALIEIMKALIDQQKSKQKK